MKLLGIIFCLPVICSCCSDPRQTSAGQLSHAVKKPDVIKIRTPFFASQKNLKERAPNQNTRAQFSLSHKGSHFHEEKTHSSNCCIGRQAFSSNKSLQIFLDIYKGTAFSYQQKAGSALGISLCMENTKFIKTNKETGALLSHEICG